MLEKYKNGNFKELSPAFKTIFKEIIHEFSNIKIVYEHFTRTYEDYDYIDFNIISVNDCSNHGLFYEKLLNLLQESFLRLKEEINSYSNSDKISFLKETKKSLEFTKILVYDYEMIEPENIFGNKDILHYRSFSMVKLIGTYSKHIENHRKFILFKCRYFAEAWLDAINDAQVKIDHLINIYELMPEMLNPSVNNVTPVREKIKTSFSVDELAYFFRLLESEKVFEIPDGKKENYYRFIAENFSSKQKEDISSKSVKNKYGSPDSKTIDSVKGILLRIITSIRNQ